MCFDTVSSLTAWSVSVLISIYLFYRGQRYDRWNAAFIVSFSTIQLLEAGLWQTINSKGEIIDAKTNEFLTKGILLTLLSQPLVQTTFATFHISDSQKFTKTLMSILSFIFLGVLFYGVYRVGSQSFKSEVGKNGHLKWQSNSKSEYFLGGRFGYLIPILYLMGLILPLLFMEGSLALLIIAVLTFIFSMLYTRGEEFGSFWCFTAVAYSIAALFV